MEKKKEKLIVIGLDGATFDIILPLVNEGHLPTFKKLLDKGASGILKSVIPPITPVAWETAVTGVNPGQHNIFDFTSYNSDYTVDFINSKDRAAMAVWDYLGKAGKKSIVFSYAMGYPPPSINGIFISGMNTPGVNTEFTSPANIKKEIIKTVPNYRIDVLGDHIVNGREDLFFEDVMDLTKTHYKAAKYLLKKYDWDLGLIFFTEPDRVNHYFFHDADPTHPFNKSKKNMNNRIQEYYKMLDGILEDLMNLYKDIPFIIFSDHGMTSLHKDIFIEEYLVEWKLLFLNKKAGKNKNLLARALDISRRYIYKIGLAEKIRRLIPGGLFTFIVLKASRLEEEKSNIDWSKTKVYFPNPACQGFRINLKGREDNGIVLKEDYEKLRNLIIKKMLSLKDPETGEKMIQKVYKREELYKGPYVENAQDLIVEAHSKYHLQKGVGRGKIGLASIEGVPKSAEHAKDGIFIFYKKGIKPKKLKAINLVDIASYILYIFGIQIPMKMEGKVNKKVFT